MATTKKRLNISLSSELDQALSRIAKRDNIPQATKAVNLLEIALMLEEDVILDTIAKGRDVKGARFIKHAQAWA